MNTSETEEKDHCYQHCSSAYQACVKDELHAWKCYVRQAQCAWSCTGLTQ